LPHLPGHPAPRRGQPVVLDRHLFTHGGTVLRGEVFREGCNQTAASNSGPTPPGLVQSSTDDLPRRSAIAARRNGAPVMSAQPMVTAEAVRKSFGRLEVLRGIDLEVAPKEVVVIIGPSGSGKTTFIRCINHLEKIQAGRLW